MGNKWIRRHKDPASCSEVIDIWLRLWYGLVLAVQEGDAFPEQFETFMSFPKTVPIEIWENFKESHKDLFTVEFWQSVQSQLADGDLPEFFPYPEDLRFRHDLRAHSV